MAETDGAYTVVFKDEANKEHTVSLKDASGLPYHEYQHPIRKPAAYRKQHHLSGFYYFSKTKILVFYESRLEMSALMRMDFDPNVEAVAAQPFRLLYKRDNKERSHVPDYFAKLKDGRELVVDVKPEYFAKRPRNKEIFKITSEVCDQAGWLYKVDTGLGEPLVSNIKWLAGYKRMPNAKDFEKYANEIVDYCKDEPRTIGYLLEKTGNPLLGKPVLLYLLWCQTVVAPLDKPITNETLVSLPDVGRRLSYVDNP